MNRQKTPIAISMMILTLITIIFWVSFSIYKVFTTDTAEIVPEEITLPIDPKLDMDTIELIKNKL